MCKHEDELALRQMLVRHAKSGLALKVLDEKDAFYPCLKKSFKALRRTRQANSDILLDTFNKSCEFLRLQLKMELAEGRRFSITSDAAQMLSDRQLPHDAEIARQSGLLHQGCIAHAIHLAFVDVFQRQEADEDEQDGLIETEEDDEDETEEDDFEGLDLLLDMCSGRILCLLNNLRRFVKKYKRRTTTAHLFAGSALQTDVPTRWNSLITMLNSILANWSTLQAAVTQCQNEAKCKRERESHKFPFTQRDQEILRRLVVTISPMKMLSDIYCRKDSSCVGLGRIAERLLAEDDEINLQKHIGTRLNSLPIFTFFSRLLSWFKDPEEDRLFGKVI
ncbi:hypothetical protein Ciccas_000597 [Cichlidogyrus casuarinus]|uniref:Uncharacterized protein n=1 Tax=Cichlidogyrus casuarinus TaxID=1844966 RepID=A0ABD2QMS3_9PLAT